MTPDSIFMPYKVIRDGYLRRRVWSRSNPADENALELAAEHLTAANKTCLDYWPWPDAIVPDTVEVANGLVTWDQVRGAQYARFWTSDPDATSGTKGTPIDVQGRDAAGLHLCTTLTSVFAKYIPRPPRFDHQPVVAGTAYPQGETVYQESTGHMLVCLPADGANGADIANAAKWRPLTVLWILVDPIINLALADALGNSEQERGQAADLRSQAAEQLRALALTHKNKP